LAIDINGQMTIYDTLDHQIGGVSQQQGSETSLTFTSQFGLVRVADLPIVSNQGVAVDPGQTGMAAPSLPPIAVEQVDVFTKIERLAELRQKGILSEAEFSAKRSEPMSRIRGLGEPRFPLPKGLRIDFAATVSYASHSLLQIEPRPPPSRCSPIQVNQVAVAQGI
jgi:hypothetical protein